MLGPQTTTFSRLFDLAAPVLILATRCINCRCPRWPISMRCCRRAAASIPATACAALGMVTETFALALRLAAPFVLAVAAWNVATGLLARLVPRLQIFFIAMPGQILGGLLLLFWLIGAILTAWADAAPACCPLRRSADRAHGRGDPAPARRSHGSRHTQALATGA